MLLRFGVSNHLSIRDYQELLLSASRRIKREGLTMPVPTVQEDIVPLAAIYGPNAAGKSNLIDALDEMQRAVVSSHKDLDATNPIPRDPFRLDDESRSNPTRFDCTFTVDGSSDDEFENVYEYGFEFTAKEFEREWLYQTVRKQRQSTQLLYERKTENGQVQVNVGGELRGENRLIEKITRPNSLFLSAAAQNNHPKLTKIYRYFAERWRVILNEAAMGEAAVVKRLLDYPHMNQLLRLVQQADVGITHIDLQEDQPSQFQLDLAQNVVGVMSQLASPEVDKEAFSNQVLDKFRHTKRLRLTHTASEGNMAFGYNLESKGTRTLISLLIPALEALSTGSLLVVDELDTSLHPDLAKAFVSLFKRESSNPHGAQLIFSTHDVTLLGSDSIQQDEIWLTDKGRDGASRFTPLTDFRLRSRDDIEKAYRAGRLGGVPSGDDFFLEFSRGLSQSTQ